MELTVCCCVYVCTIGVRVVQEEPANTEVKHSEHGREDTCVSVHHCEIDEWLSECTNYVQTQSLPCLTVVYR